MLCHDVAILEAHAVLSHKGWLAGSGHVKLDRNAARPSLRFRLLCYGTSLLDTANVSA